ncbi:Predicted metal-dependent hydrolase, TIM-barrel fold [Brevibacterium siliguriense]|uniref:Predicted metal-dependent hydrolase, TIM-barrel fold n=1 Tax=Brevibacterium siliguriense TaxID=1136497 RepID=A0A1H1LFS6_9MICO|nr:amidohydrolase family protein [Brevibacterium siliguriense]SDR73434.1 Predicted metal-dependent hydrolase, TIM-barrel fold [Brevibacterium siliguriense]
MSELQRAFDAHLHIIDPTHPLIENNGYLPDPFTVADYRSRLRSLPEVGVEIAGGAVVSGSFQGFDQGYLIEALRQLGGSYVGVTQLPDETTDDLIRQLDEAGIKALRFNIARGGSAALDALDSFARRVHDLVGWHAELYIDASTIDADLADRIASLPAVSIDHLGMHEDGLPTLLRLVEAGVKVKATGFGRVELDPTEVVRRIVDTDPNALMVGTDLPSTRARRPFADADFTLLRQTLTPAEADAVFYSNAAKFYGID